MADCDPPSPADSRTLQEIFVSVTGETAVTLRQVQGPSKKVIDATGSGLPPREQRPDTDPAANALEDAIGGPEHE